MVLVFLAITSLRPMNLSCAGMYAGTADFQIGYPSIYKAMQMGEARGESVVVLTKDLPHVSLCVEPNLSLGCIESAVDSRFSREALDEFK